MREIENAVPPRKRVRAPKPSPERVARELRQRLRDLVAAVDTHLTVLDALMKLPSSPERGAQIARLANRLNVAHDAAAHFGLGRSFASLAKSRRTVLDVDRIKRWLEPTEAERVARGERP